MPGSDPDTNRPPPPWRSKVFRRFGPHLVSSLSCTLPSPMECTMLQSIYLPMYSACVFVRLSPLCSAGASLCRWVHGTPQSERCRALVSMSHFAHSQVWFTPRCSLPHLASVQAVDLGLHPMDTPPAWSRLVVQTPSTEVSSSRYSAASPAWALWPLLPSTSLPYLLTPPRRLL